MKVLTKVDFKEVSTRHVDNYLLDEIISEFKVQLYNKLECRTIDEDSPIFIHLRIELNNIDNGNNETTF